MRGPYQGPQDIRWSKVTRYFREPDDEWLPLPGSGGRDFFNATRHRELVALGLVPELPSPTERRPTVAKKKDSGIASLSKTALRKKLLETITIPDKAWAAWREKHGIEAVREKGESREAYIRRVLA